MRSLSVSSTSRLPGSKPVLRSACSTLPARSPCSAWRGETLTLTATGSRCSAESSLPHAAGLGQREALDLGDQPGLLGQRHELERRHDLACRAASAGAPRRPRAGRRRDRRSAACSSSISFSSSARWSALTISTRRAEASRRLVSNSAKRPRPPCLAAYIATSASRIRSVAVCGVAARERDADAAADVDLAARHAERLRERGEHAARHDLGAAGVAGRQVGGELVAAEAREHVALAQRGLQPPAGLAQERIARLVAVAVVDELEAVDVDEQHGARGRALAVSELLLELARELAAVDEPRERVVLRRVRQLQLGVLALGDVGEDALEAGLAVARRRPSAPGREPTRCARRRAGSGTRCRAGPSAWPRPRRSSPARGRPGGCAASQSSGSAIHCSGGKPSIASI